MSGLDWSILRGNGPVDIAGNFARGYKVADEIISTIRERQALGALAADPDDRNALAALYRANPQTATQMETMNMKRHEVARAADARNAMAALVARMGPQQFTDLGPQPNALTGAMPEPVIDSPAVTAAEPVIDSPVARDTPGTAINAPSAIGDPVPGPEGPPPATNEDEIVVAARRPSAPAEVSPDLAPEWAAFAQADPEGAMKMLIDRQSLSRKQALAVGAQMDMIGRLASTVTDQPTLDRALAYADALGLDTRTVPREYTPAAVEGIKYQAMHAKEAIKTKHDIKDDEIDNARADAALKLRERIAGQADATKRRGQDLTDARGRRGQDVASTDRRRGQDMRPAPKGGKGGGMPRVKSVAEARALPPGTMFIDPQGNVRKR